MLAHVLTKRGIGARVVSNQEVSPGSIIRLDVGGIDTAVVSYLDSDGFANARYLVRRLRRRLPARVRIVLGLWTQTGAAFDRSGAAAETEADSVATSLAQAVETVTK